MTGEIGGILTASAAIAMALVALLLFIFSFFAKIQGGVKWASLVFLDVVLQWAFAFGGFLVAWQLGAFHTLNAIILAGIGMKAYSNAKKPAVEAQAPVGGSRLIRITRSRESSYPPETACA